METLESFRICPHYDTIVNASYPEDDVLTSQFISDYRDLVLGNETEPEILKQLDLILNEYVKQEKFYKHVQMKYQQNLDLLYSDVQILIGLYEIYKNEPPEHVSNTKWL